MAAPPTAPGVAAPLRVVLEAIVGTYKLMRTCGGACGSLHKRVRVGAADAANAADADGDMYLFIDPDRVGPADEDSFVFSRSCRHLQLGEVRPIARSIDRASHSSEHGRVV